MSDDQLLVIEEGAILIKDGKILEVGKYKRLKDKSLKIYSPGTPSTAIPGLIDAHTHICFSGSRAKDYALRISGISYQEIAANGGGILDTVAKTRVASSQDLADQMLVRLQRQLKEGVTTCEVKSGYGLSTDQELKMLRAIRTAASLQSIDLIPTCLAAHTVPKEFFSPKDYLQDIARNLFPLLKKEKLSRRIDIFIEKGAFSKKEAIEYLKIAKTEGFQITVHANQFSRGGVEVAAKLGASSADHLEVMHKNDLRFLREANVAPVVLPGASIGLGVPYAPARKMLDEGLALAIASDWNPGSAPMGRLLTEAAAIGAAEKLTMSETLAALTIRAASALKLEDRGVLKKGMRADFAVFPCSDFREILYNQGSLLPSSVYIKGAKCLNPDKGG